MIHHDPPPDPSHFSDYKEYQLAVEMYEKMEEKLPALNRILHSGRPQEWIDDQMQKLGLQKWIEPLCGRPWCKENKMCLYKEIHQWQHAMDGHFFKDILADEDLLLPQEEANACFDADEGCDLLPQRWHLEGSVEHETLCFFLQLCDVATYGCPKKVSFDELAAQGAFASFQRDLYLFTLHLVRRRSWQERRRGLRAIEHFLRTTTLLNAAQKDRFLEEFLNLREVALVCIPTLGSKYNEEVDCSHA